MANPQCKNYLNPEQFSGRPSWSLLVVFVHTPIIWIRTSFLLQIKEEPEPAGTCECNPARGMDVHATNGKQNCFNWCGRWRGFVGKGGGRRQLVHWRYRYLRRQHGGRRGAGGACVGRQWEPPQCCINSSLGIIPSAGLSLLMASFHCEGRHRTSAATGGRANHILHLCPSYLTDNDVVKDCWLDGEMVAGSNRERLYTM